MARIVKIVGVIVGLAIGAWGFFVITAKPITNEQAEAIAANEVRRASEQLRFNLSDFHGPEPFLMTSHPHAFQWTYTDNAGVVRLLVFVDDYGGVELTWEGDLEPLRKWRQQQRDGMHKPKTLDRFASQAVASAHCPA